MLQRDIDESDPMARAMMRAHGCKIVQRSIYKIGVDTSDEDSDGFKQEKAGTGVLGRGPPMTVKSAGKKTELQ